MVPSRRLRDASRGSRFRRSRESRPQLLLGPRGARRASRIRAAPRRGGIPRAADARGRASRGRPGRHDRRDRRRVRPQLFRMSVRGPRAGAAAASGILRRTRGLSRAAAGTNPRMRRGGGNRARQLRRAPRRCGGQHRPEHDRRLRSLRRRPGATERAAEARSRQAQLHSILVGEHAPTRRRRRDAPRPHEQRIRHRARRAAGRSGRSLRFMAALLSRHGARRLSAGRRRCAAPGRLHRDQRLRAPAAALADAHFRERGHHLVQPELRVRGSARGAPRTPCRNPSTSGRGGSPASGET